jgi:hypothetical protein
MAMHSGLRVGENLCSDFYLSWAPIFCTGNPTFCALLQRIGMRPVDGWSAFRALFLLSRSFGLSYMFVFLFLSFFLSSITFHAFIYFVGILHFCYKYSFSSWLKQIFDIQNIFPCLSWFYGYQLITNIETLLGNFNSWATPHRGHYVTNCTDSTVPVSVLILLNHKKKHRDWKLIE